MSDSDALLPTMTREEKVLDTVGTSLDSFLS
jgi:hypothetical protein